MSKDNLSAPREHGRVKDDLVVSIVPCIVHLQHGNVNLHVQVLLDRGCYKGTFLDSSKFGFVSTCLTAVHEIRLLDHIDCGK